MAGQCRQGRLQFQAGDSQVRHAGHEAERRSADAATQLQNLFAGPGGHRGSQQHGIDGSAVAFQGLTQGHATAKQLVVAGCELTGGRSAGHRYQPSPDQTSSPACSSRRRAAP